MKRLLRCSIPWVKVLITDRATSLFGWKGAPSHFYRKKRYSLTMFKVRRHRTKRKSIKQW